MMDSNVLQMPGIFDPPPPVQARGGVLLNPIGGGGGGAANMFPIILGGSHSLIGYVVANSAVALKLFKVMVVTGSTDFSLKDQLKDPSVVAKVNDLMTTADFAEGSDFDFREKGYLNLFETFYAMKDAYDTVLEAYNSSEEHVGPDVKGIIAICVSGTLAVRPSWAKKQGKADDAAGLGDDEATQYYLTCLDFGTEAQLATWDGSKYACDYDENGEMLKTPVVKRVYVSECPNSPAEGGST